MWIGYLVIAVVVALCTTIYLEETEPTEEYRVLMFVHGAWALIGGALWPILVLIAGFGLGIPLLYRRWIRKRAAEKKQKPVNTEPPPPV